MFLLLPLRLRQHLGLPSQTLGVPVPTGFKALSFCQESDPGLQPFGLLLSLPAGISGSLLSVISGLPPWPPLAFPHPHYLCDQFLCFILCGVSFPSQTLTIY